MPESTGEALRDRDLYELLQVHPRAEPPVIDAAYRALVRSYHPDVSRDPNATRRMHQLNAAYHTLCHPGRRAQYDGSRTRSARVRAGKPAVRMRHHARARPRPILEQPSLAVISPVGRTLLMGSVMALVVVLSLLVWFVFDALDERPPYSGRFGASSPSASVAPIG